MYFQLSTFLRKIFYFKLAILILVVACKSEERFKRPDKRILVYSPVYETDAPGNVVLSTILDIKGLLIETTQTSLPLRDDSIKQYSALILINVNPKNFTPREQSNVERYVQSGGGLVTIDSELDNQYYWPWYYGFINKSASTAKGTAERFNYDGGRTIAVNTSKGSISRDHLQNWVNYAMGENIYDASQIHSPKAPDEKRFIKKILDNEVNEPMELAVLPDGRVLFIEREGAVKLYNPKEQATKTIDVFDVHTEGNYEDGMLGLAIHPLFEFNNWVYIYYSPVGDEPKQNLSRFRLVGDSLLRFTEQIILEVPVQRETCCHSAGSIVFGPDGNLYLSTGDNTSSKESDGYTPIDERPGRGPFDAQKSSGNTMDLRGKILRIKPKADGSYEIPEGNLFSREGFEGKPEIYLMGLRNPFRFAVDPLTTFVYWGDVGPDAGEDSKLGPKSYDEFNQARGPGFYGWPYFVGNNIPYPNLDFATGDIGPLFNPDYPVNDSPNNTGDTLLPPAQQAMIWYPYDESAEFPMLGTGSRSALGGPFYYNHLYLSGSKVKFPDYFSGKWFIYDWARSWIKVVSFDKNHHLAKIEPFLPDVEFGKPIDMEFGPDGAMYLLEYGTNYFTNNDNATLSKIEYHPGNMVPIPSIDVDKEVGAVPLTVNFSAEGSFDYDRGDSLQYEWFFTSDRQPDATGPVASFTFDKPGIYPVKLKVIDPHNESAWAEKELKVGNDLPEISINLQGNSTFFFDQFSPDYKVTVKDREDGSSYDGSIPQDIVQISFNYLPHGKDLALIGPQDFSTSARYLRGKNLIASSDCGSCHALDEKSIGPSYQEIAVHYKDDYGAIEFLPQKIISGGSGNWGPNMMAAHPQHTMEEATEMVEYILSLAEEKNEQASLPLEGKLLTNKHEPEEESGAYVFTVSYQDQGGKVVGPLTARESLILRHPKWQAEDYDQVKDAGKYRPQGGDLSYVSPEKNGGYLVLEDIDLTNIKSLVYHTRSNMPASISLKIDNINGELIGQANITPANESGQWTTTPISIQPQQGNHDLYFVFQGPFEKEGTDFKLDWILFEQGVGPNF